MATKLEEIQEKLRFQLALKKIWTERGTQEFLDSKLAEQQAVIDEAIVQKNKLKANFENSNHEVQLADANIEKLNKKIASWTYRSEIKKLQRTLDQLKELENEDN